MVSKKTAEELHEDVPPDWYYSSIRKNLFQRYWHRRRFKEVKKYIDEVHGNVLDIGSADGVFSEIILNETRAKNLVGIEVLKKSVDWANNHWRKNKKMEFKVGNAHNLEFSDGEFDAVFALEVIEHVHNPEKVLAEINRVLKKNGYAILLVPSESVLFKIIWYFWGFYRGKIWKDTHQHKFSNNKLEILCKKTGFEIAENKKFILGMLQILKVK